MDMKQQIGQYADRGFRTAWIILLLWIPHGVVHAQENTTRDSLSEDDTSRSTASAFVADHLNAAFGMGTDHGWLGLNVGLGFLSIGEFRAGLHCSIEPSLFELPLLIHLHIGATLPVDRIRIRVSLGPTYIDRPTAQLHDSRQWSQFIPGSSVTTTWLPFESAILGIFLSGSLMTDIPDNGDLLWNAGGGVSFGFHR